jgi:uncharacterized protein (TIGR02001 family)
MIALSGFPQVGNMVERRPFPAQARSSRSHARIGLGFLAAIGAACCMAPAHAQSTHVNGGVALTSQLVDRGVAITPATPVLQGTVSWNTAAGWSLGVSGSAEVRSPGRIVEAMAQVSRSWSLSSDWQMQAGLLYYSYSGTARSNAYDRWEMDVNWIYRDVLTLGLSALRAVGTRDSRVTAAADAGFRWPLTRHVSFSAGAGVAQSLGARRRTYTYGDSGTYHHHAYRHDSPYRYGQVGLLWSDGAWRVEIDRIATDLGARRQRVILAASPWVATISRTF